MTEALNLAGQYLIFGVGAEEYGIDLRSVREIRSYEEPTRIAGAPDSVRGVVNLRGVIVPLLDMRLRLRTNADIAPGIVSIMVNAGGKTIGMVVDTVSGVVDLTHEHIRPLPGFRTATEATCLKGLAIIEGRMLQLLDVERLASSNDLGFLQPSELLAA